MATAVPAQVGAPKSSSVAVAVVANPVAVASVVVAADDDAPPEGCAPQGCLTRAFAIVHTIMEVGPIGVGVAYLFFFWLFGWLLNPRLAEIRVELAGCSDPGWHLDGEEVQRMAEHDIALLDEVCSWWGALEFWMLPAAGPQHLVFSTLCIIGSFIFVFNGCCNCCTCGGPKGKVNEQIYGAFSGAGAFFSFFGLIGLCVIYFKSKSLMDAIRAHPNNDRVEDIPNCDRTSYNYDAQNCNRNMQRREQAEERDRRQENELLGFGFMLLFSHILAFGFRFAGSIWTCVGHGMGKCGSWE